MVHFQDYIADRLKYWLEKDTLSEESLAEVTGIMIVGEEYAQMPPIGIPWEATATAHNMKLPNVLLNINELKDGWEEELTQIKGILSLWVLVPVTGLSFISEFPNLRELYVMFNECDNWDFLALLQKLNMLFVAECPHFNIIPLGTLSRANNLKHIILIRCNISDISVLSSFKGISELNLSFNSITNISPLSNVSIYYLTLRWNKITDLSPLAHMPYLLNVRHNEIDTWLNFKNGNKPNRLLIKHNKSYDNLDVSNLHLVHCDFSKEKAALGILEF